MPLNQPKVTVHDPDSKALRPIKSLVVTTSFPTSREDYCGHFVARSAEWMAASGWTVTILAPPGPYHPPNTNRISYRTCPGILDGAGGPECLQSHPLKATAAGFLTSLSMLYALIRSVRKFDILVAHWLIPCGVLACLGGRLFRRSVHLYGHGGDIALLEQFPRALRRRVARFMDKNAAGISFVSERLRQRFVACLEGQVTGQHNSLPMGVDTPQPDGKFKTTLMSKVGTRKIIASVGRLVAIKGFDLIPEALKDLDNVVWCIAGDGPERSRLETLCTHYGVRSLFLGRVSPSERDALLNIAEVFVAPSRIIGKRTEGCPLSVLEALNSGVPTVTCGDGSTGYFGQNEATVVVPINDAALLGQAIARILADPPLGQKLSRQGLETVRPLHWRHTGVRFMDDLKRSANLSATTN